MVDLACSEAPAEAELARFAAECRFEKIPESVRHEAKRSLVNIFGTALAGCREPAIETMLATMQPFAGAPSAGLIGRPERTDAALAACLNAAAANIFDFDDTHEATIIHPAAPVFAALFAAAESREKTGAEVLRGVVLGGEVTCRIGLALAPGHYARGWHITSTAGVFGAAAGTGTLLGLPPDKMKHALAAAAGQSAGLVETLGTDAKSLSVGASARGGLLAALLAEAGFTGPSAPLTGTRGFLNVYGDPPSPDALLADLGECWEIAANTYKPYPVGVVLNPVIEAILSLRAEQGLTLDAVASIELTGHPLLRQRTDRPDVATGRSSQVSAQHAIAIALLDGRATLDDFTDQAAARTLAAGRPKVDFHDDPAHSVASARLVVHLRDGSSLEADIAEAQGSRSNPLSDSQLEAKLRAAAERSGWQGDASRLIDALWQIETVDNAADIIRLARAP